MGVERKETGAAPGRRRPPQRPRAGAPRAHGGEGPQAVLPAPAAAVRYVTVGSEHAGQRLDNFLIRLSKGVPKSHIYRVVRSGEVRINRGRAAADQRLSAGDEIRIPPMRTGVRPGRAAPADASALPVVFEDEHLLVVDKPSAMAAHGGSGVSFGVIERIRAARPSQPFLELAHRLDRDTSGLLVLAKSRRALLRLHAMLRQGEVEKRYLALVAGRWLNDRQHVKLALSKVAGGGAGKVRIDPEGAAAHTVFEMRERFRQFTLLEAELRTGRTHQIRVHLAHLGFPIAGDGKYGDFELNRRLARGEFGVPFARMGLHAWKLRLKHPVSGEPVALESPLPAECESLLEALRRA